MPKLKQPSIRAQKYIKNKISGMNSYKSAIEAGYTPATAKNAVKNVENHGVANSLYEALREVGVTNELLAERIAEGLSANKIIVFANDIVQIPDFITRFRYIQLATSLAATSPLVRENLTIQVVTYEDPNKENLPKPIYNGESTKNCRND